MDISLIREWFIKRFGRQPEEDLGYFEEWVRRFKLGWAFSAMDHKSFAVWQEVQHKAAMAGAFNHVEK